MARERLVTRTITTATVDVMTVAEREVVDLSYNIGSVAGLKECDIEKRAWELCPDGNIFVKVMGIHYNEVLYGMSEADFIKYAKVLPARASEKAETGE